MKKYVVLGILCSFASLHMVLFGCTMGLVSTQKETRGEQEICALKEKDKNWVKFRSKDGITTYIIRDKNGKKIGMRMVKEPRVNIPAPRCYHDTKTILVNQDPQEEVRKTKIANKQWFTSLFPLSEIPAFQEVKKDSYNKTHISSFGPSPGEEGVYEKQDTEIRDGMSQEEDRFKKEEITPVLSGYRQGESVVERSPHEPGGDSDIWRKDGEKTYSLGMAFPAKWLPGFVLRAMELNNERDVKFKIPIPSLDRDVKFGLKYESRRQVISNNYERIIIGLFTIAFGGKEDKKAANLATTEF